MKSNANQELSQNERLFKKAVQKGQVAFQRGDCNSVMAWAKIAAHFAFARHPGFYTDLTLESLLLNVAHELDKESENLNSFMSARFKAKDYGKMRFLHIITESYDADDHSSFIARWIENTTNTSVHNLIITSNHNSSLPKILSSAVRKSGGWHFSLPALTTNLYNQALFLRQFARDWADVVVLFVHPFDPVPTVSFGVDGGPPIIFCNHADHAFWLGSSIADVIADYHSSGGLLSAKRRGTQSSTILPIPLPKNIVGLRDVTARNKLGVCDDEVMLLTVGREEKFFPFGNYDFLNVLVKVLKQHPNAKLFAAGPTHQGRWKIASDLVEGRITALGTVDRTVLDSFYQAADLYVGSFPCGSGTAMLEAGIHNLPILGLHIKELPHFSGGDDVALKNLGTFVSSTGDFIASLNSMINDCSLFRQKASLIKEHIEQEHCFPGWNAYLDNLLQSLPSQHTVHKPKPIDAQTDYADAYFAHLCSEMFLNELPEYSLGRLVRVYAKNLPKIDAVNAQMESFLRALPKVDSVKKCKEYLYNLREFLNFTFN